jgi:predicted ABC-type ATPase
VDSGLLQWNGSRFANTWEVYDNSESEPRLVAFGGQAESTTVMTSEIWQRLIERTP